MSLFDRAITAMVPLIPRAIVGRVASRYVAGETLADAIRTTSEITRNGAMATIDVLGEEISEIEEATGARDAYLEVLDAISEHGLKANVSIKLTAFGLRLDAERCYELVKAVVDRARDLDNFVRIDMEDSSTTDATIALYRRLRDDGFENTGIVLQAYLHRTIDDVETLADLRPNYRLCKGIYREPPDIAFQRQADIEANFLHVLDRMFDLGSYVGIATHHRGLVSGAREIIEQRRLSCDDYEFQMLLGVDATLGREIMGRGDRLRIYIPFGKQWYAYCIRRLKENPRIGRYVFLAMFDRGDRKR